LYEFFHRINPSPEAIPPFYENGFLFLQTPYLLDQLCRPLHYFALTNTQTDRVEARCAVFIRNGWAVSPCATSFGSVEFSEMLPAEALRALISEISAQCAKEGVRGIRMVSYPDCYAPNQARRLRATLLSAGFSVKYEEFNQHLTVSDQPFVAHLHAAERRRLRKCQQAGFTSGPWLNPDVDALFDLIKNARLRKGFPVSMSRDALAQLLTAFGEVCPVFAVWDGSQLIAACIGIRVTEEILYYFLPADHADYLKFSPAVMLVESLYQYAQQHRMTLLDLGISTSQGVRNEGLIQFKQRLGAVGSPKLVFEKLF